MNPILLSFLCGAAFIGGAAATTCFVVLAMQLKDRKGRDELFGYWKESISKHTEQVAILNRIAAVMEKQNNLRKE